MKTLHTNLYTDFAKQILEYAVQRMLYLPGSFPTKFKSRFNGITIDRLPNGEVVFNAETDMWIDKRSFANKHDDPAKALIWFARTMRYAMKQHDPTIVWKRTSTATFESTNLQNSKVLPNIHPTVQELSLAYDILLSKKHIEAKYPAEVISKVQGTERDALATELEAARLEEIKRIKEKWEPILADLNPDKYRSKADVSICKTINAMRNKLAAEWRRKYKAALNEQEKEIGAVSKEIDATIA